jgi:NAD+ synthase (glutamine-hydrolysing)
MPVKLVKVAASVINQTPFDWSGNHERIRSVLRNARQQNISVLCLPELAISGYGCEDAFYMPHLAARSWQMLLDLLPECKGMVVSLGLPFFHRGALFNAIAVVADGKIVAIVPKKLLAGDGVHYEPRWFKPWPSGVIETIEIGDDKVVVGDVYVNCGGIKIGFEICEEAWVANRPGATLARLGVDIMMNPSASHFAFGKRQIRERFVAEGSRAFNVAYLYANLLGNESGRIIFDGGAMIASEGKIVGRGPRFGYQDFITTVAVVDIDLNRMNRARSGSFQPLIGEETGHSVDIDFEWPEIDGSASSEAEFADGWELAAELKAEEFTRAVALGLFDFLRKSRLHGFTISISGGVDSAAVTALAAMSIKLAESQIGMSGVKERLGYISKIHNCHSVSDVVRSLISCAYQSTNNSSDLTADAAKSVSEALGVEFYDWTVDELTETYKSIVGSATSTEWDWKTHDTTLQNIQARARGPSIWMLANLKNHLLLATSNRSEAAVGYATMDGDTCGGLSPLAGIDKAYLRRWLVWLEKIGPAGLGPVPSMAKVNKIPPTAELRPAAMHQTDEADLMPYDVLDLIERAAIRDKKSPREVYSTVTGKFPGATSEQRKLWVKRFFMLWCRNQWKRERYAPGFHLDDESLDPKTWCRFPILSGGFLEELQQLDGVK